jgi:hypothetical protein
LKQSFVQGDASVHLLSSAIFFAGLAILDELRGVYDRADQIADIKDGT